MRRGGERIAATKDPRTAGLPKGRRARNLSGLQTWEKAMRTNRRVRSVTLVLILIPALALLVSNPVEAKKKPKPPTPPEWSWAVDLPVCALSNLCAGQQTTYADTGVEDGVWADVSKEGSQGGTQSHFGFAVFKCEEGELCYEASPDPLTLQGVAFDDWSLGEGPPCVFPDQNPSCEDTAPGWMQ